MIRAHPRSTLFPYPPLFRSVCLLGTAVPVLFLPNLLSLEGPPRAVVQIALPTLWVLLVLTPQERRFLHGQVARWFARPTNRSEEHTSELQSQSNLVCRLLLE